VLLGITANSLPKLPGRSSAGRPREGPLEFLKIDGHEVWGQLHRLRVAVLAVHTPCPESPSRLLRVGRREYASICALRPLLLLRGHFVGFAYRLKGSARVVLGLPLSVTEGLLPAPRKHLRTLGGDRPPVTDPLLRQGHGRHYPTPCRLD